MDGRRSIFIELDWRSWSAGDNFYPTQSLECNFPTILQKEPMPEVSRIKGVIFRVYNGDHPPPHFHALYQEDEALIDIQRSSV